MSKTVKQKLLQAILKCVTSDLWMSFIKTYDTCIHTQQWFVLHQVSQKQHFGWETENLPVKVNLD